jgi:Tfp pilus assembly protein PilN
MAKNNNTALTSNKKLVIKLMPETILASLTTNNAGQISQTEVVRWKLPKKINPNDINQDLELLTASISTMVEHHGLEGETVTLILPHRIAATRILEIPMNLDNKAEKKEFASLTKTNPYDFWKEHDTNLATLKSAEIRSHYLMALPEDNATKMLYTMVSAKEIKDYITLFLGGNLYPTSFISEDQALIRIVESKLSRVERERPFCIFHLCKGNSRIIHVTPESMNMAAVDIDELDEVLLDDLPTTTEEINNDFWKEVIARLSNALKQAVMFLNDETKVEKFDSVFFCTDYVNEPVLFELFRDNFRLANFKSLASHFSLKDHGSKDDKVSNQQGTQFITHAGCYPIHYSSTPSIPNPLISAPLFNLHPAHAFIENNFGKEPSVRSSLRLGGLVLVLLLAINIFMMVLVGNSNQVNALAQTSQQTLGTLEKQSQALQNQLSAKKQVLAKLDNMASAEKKQHLLYFISRQLPVDTELSSVLIYQEQFSLQGNARNVASINDLFGKFSKQEKIKGLNLTTYKKNNGGHYFFRITGNLVGEL